MRRRGLIAVGFIALVIHCHLQVSASAGSLRDHGIESVSPFCTALKTLQEQIRYTFKNINLLRRAMTHASYSEENNKALSILGASAIETAVSLRSLRNDADVSAKELNRRMSEVSNVESSCTADGMRLGLEKVVRVSPKTNSSAPAVVCGAFRAVFGAIAVDNGTADSVGAVFWRVHGGGIGRAFALRNAHGVQCTEFSKRRHWLL